MTDNPKTISTPMLLLLVAIAGVAVVVSIQYGNTLADLERCRMEKSQR